MTGAPDQQQAGQAAVKPGPDRLLFQIQTFTARYDPAEDRLRLDAIDAKGHKQALLLTRRLADRIIPVLVSHLEGGDYRSYGFLALRFPDRERWLRATKASMASAK